LQQALIETLYSQLSTYGDAEEVTMTKSAHDQHTKRKAKKTRKPGIAAHHTPFAASNTADKQTRVKKDVATRTKVSL
jgi:hypothetical protein